MLNKFRKISGFTLIELIIVIGIVAVLATIAIGALNPIGQLKKARDAERRSDLSHYRSTLEVYANKNNGSYPLSVTVATLSGTTAICTSLGLSTCTNDPTDPTLVYRYCSDAGAINYTLWATLEYPASPTRYWVACSNGKSGVSATAPVLANCGAGYSCILP